jgi:drug/metabolite transporter (DMT)-like permease
VQGELLGLLPSPLVLGALAYQTLVIAFASYLAWFWLLTRYPASQMAAFTSRTPLLGLAAGAVLLGEPVSGRLAGGAALVVAGIYLVNREVADTARPSAGPPRRSGDGGRPGPASPPRPAPGSDAPPRSSPR